MLVVYLVAPDLRTLGGYELQLTTLAVALARNGYRPVVFFREPVRNEHPYLARMLDAGVHVHFPHPIAARVVSPSQSIRSGAAHVTIGICLPVLAVVSVIDAILRRRSFLRSLRGSIGWWRGQITSITQVDSLTWLLCRTMDIKRRILPPDIIDVQHSMIPYAIEYALNHGIPVVYTEYGAPSRNLESVWSGLRPVLNSVDLVIGRAEASISGLAELCGLDNDVPWTIVPNAVTAGPPADFESPSDQPSYGQDVVIATIGRLSAEKGTRDVLSAFRLLVNDGLPVHLVLAGEGPLRPELEAMARDWKISDRVTITGAFGDLAPIIRATDIVAHPTLNDGRSVSVLEAMAWGRPVVGTAVGGVAEIVQDGVTGFLVQPGAIDEMASALKRLVTDAGLRRTQGQAARAAFQAGGFGPDEMVSGTLAAYHRVLDGPMRKSAR